VQRRGGGSGRGAHRGPLRDGRGYEAKAIETRRRSIDRALVRIPERLPGRFGPATFTAAPPGKGETVRAGGYGLAREGDAKTTGTFRTASLKVIEPYGPSRILLWAQGAGVVGACEGDSGGPMTSGDGIVAITTWAKGTGRSSCGGMTQGILVGPQRAWIDRTLKEWNRTAQWGND
jgi:hypothetical protein